MKTLILLLFPIFCFSQDTIRVKHKEFTDVYSVSKKYVVLAEWTESPATLDCSKHLARTNKFYADKHEPDLNKDYVGTGYDKGHNFPASSANCDSATEHDCFVFSNITPQAKWLNRGKWKMLESLSRKIADKGGSYKFNDKTISVKPGIVKIWCGSFGNTNKFIGKDHVSVPAFCWKVLYIKSAGYYAAFVFPNTNDRSTDIYKYEVPLSTVEKDTGFKF